MQKSTCIRDSIVGDAWIQEMCRINPVQRVIGEDGKPTGAILTGPVRLAFVALLQPEKKMKKDPNSATGFFTTLLWTPYSDLSIFWEEYYRVCAADFAQFYNATTQQYYVDNPIFDQGSKANYSGYTPGCWATNVSSQFKPPVVDMRGNPITDQSKVYPGVWAVVAVNAYASGKNSPRKGPRFGLSTVMIVGDDTPLAGGAADPRTTFKGVQVKPSAVAPTAAFAQAGATPPMGGPGAPYYPPSGIAAPPGFAPGAAPPPGQVAAYVPGHMPPPPPGSGNDEDLSGLM